MADEKRDLSDPGDSALVSDFWERVDSLKTRMIDPLRGNWREVVDQSQIDEAANTLRAQRIAELSSGMENRLPALEAKPPKFPVDGVTVEMKPFEPMFLPSLMSSKFPRKVMFDVMQKQQTDYAWLPRIKITANALDMSRREDAATIAYYLRNFPLHQLDYELMARELKSEPPFDGWCVYSVIRFLCAKAEIAPAWLEQVPYYVPPGARVDAPFGPAAFDCPYFILPLRVAPSGPDEMLFCQMGRRNRQARLGRLRNPPAPVIEPVVIDRPEPNLGEVTASYAIDTIAVRPEKAAGWPYIEWEEAPDPFEKILQSAKMYCEQARGFWIIGCPKNTRRPYAYIPFQTEDERTLPIVGARLSH